MDQENDKKSIENMTNLDIVEVFWKGLNKANTSGVFSIDEAFTLKVLYEKIKKNLE